MKNGRMIVLHLLGIGAVTVHMLDVGMLKTVARTGITFYIQIHTQMAGERLSQFHNPKRLCFSPDFPT